MKKNLFGLLVLLLCGLLPASGTSAAQDSDYRVGTDDVLRVTVYDHPDLATTARVDNEGMILFPLAGAIKVGGLTTSAASAAIATKLDGVYIVNPQVAVFVEQFRSKKVVIIGEVNRPGLYELSGPTSLLELISQAGGLTKEAGQEVTINHAGKDGAAKELSDTINIEGLLRDGRGSNDMPLYDGDMVTVSKAGVVYVTGQVNRPSVYRLEPGTTVIKAITMAGGFTNLAAQNKVRIIRKLDGREQVLEKVPMHTPLRAEDVMVVPESFF